MSGISSVLRFTFSFLASPKKSYFAVAVSERSELTDSDSDFKK